MRNIHSAVILTLCLCLYSHSRAEEAVKLPESLVKAVQKNDDGKVAAIIVHNKDNQDKDAEKRIIIAALENPKIIPEILAKAGNDKNKIGEEIYLQAAKTIADELLISGNPSSNAFSDKNNAEKHVNTGVAQSGTVNEENNSQAGMASVSGGQAVMINSAQASQSLNGAYYPITANAAASANTGVSIGNPTPPVNQAALVNEVQQNQVQQYVPVPAPQQNSIISSTMDNKNNWILRSNVEPNTTTQIVSKITQVSTIQDVLNGPTKKAE